MGPIVLVGLVGLVGLRGIGGSCGYGGPKGRSPEKKVLLDTSKEI